MVHSTNFALKSSLLFTIPNLITAVNLFLGCINCSLIAMGYWEYSLWLFGGCLLADLLDGYIARKMDLSSDLGIQLDSLADVISFGLAPGLIAFQLLATFDIPGLIYLGFLLPVAAAFRLARFNLKLNSSSIHFQGLPVPAMAIFMAGLIPFGQKILFFQNLFTSSAIPMVICIIFLSGCMISTLPIIKFEPNYNWLKDHLLLSILMVLCLIGIALGYIPFLSLLIILYTLMSYLTLIKFSKKTI